MVREVVDHGDAAARADQLLPSLDAVKGAESAGERRGLEAVQPGCRPDRERVGRVVHAPDPEGELALAAVRLGDADPQAVGRGARRAEQPEVVVLPLAVEDDRTGSAPGERAHLGGVAAGDQAAIRRQESDQPGIGVGERRGGRIEIDVIVLDGGEDHGLRPVVQELGAAVEIGRVVLVALDDESPPRAAMEARAEIDRHAAHQEAGIPPAGGVDPGGHRRRRGLAVRPGDHQRRAVGEEEAGQRRGHRQALETEPFRFDRFGIVAAHGVAHHHEIRARRKMRRVETGPGDDAGLLEQVAHRRIERAVGAGDAMALGLQKAGERRHSGAADGDQVEMKRALGQRGACGLVEGCAV